jgi:hypothetical protein
MNQPNPIQIQKFLKGVDYPVDRDMLVEHAKSQGADEDVLRQLEQLPDRTYEGPNAISKEIGGS